VISFSTRYCETPSVAPIERSNSPTTSTSIAAYAMKIPDGCDVRMSCTLPLVGNRFGIHAEKPPKTTAKTISSPHRDSNL
jgi:hypothetical protein